MLYNTPTDDTESANGESVEGRLQWRDSWHGLAGTDKQAAEKACGVDDSSTGTAAVAAAVSVSATAVIDLLTMLTTVPAAESATFSSAAKVSAFFEMLCGHSSLPYGVLEGSMVCRVAEAAHVPTFLAETVSG